MTALPWHSPRQNDSVLAQPDQVIDEGVLVVGGDVLAHLDAHHPVEGGAVSGQNFGVDWYTGIQKAHFWHNKVLLVGEGHRFSAVLVDVASTVESVPRYGIVALVS